ncbi:hypothetical protein PG984_014148 [Apiospora sp. TS-2023a]
MPKGVLGHYLSRLPCSAVWIWPAGCVGSAAQEKCERKGRFGSEGVTLELPCGLPWSEGSEKDDGRRGPAATTGPRVFDTPRLLPPAAHVAVAVDLVVAGAGAILSARGLPWSYPVAYPGSGNKMGGSEVHGPRATTSLAPAGSPWGGA